MQKLLASGDARCGTISRLRTLTNRAYGHIQSCSRAYTHTFWGERTMNTIPHTLFACVLVVAAGCATVKVPVSTGGSRADATVDMSFDYGMFEKPTIDWNQTGATASKRCGAWGYTGAESFGGAKETCLAFNGYGNCVRQRVTMTYQCTGTGAPAP